MRYLIARFSLAVLLVGVGASANSQVLKNLGAAPIIAGVQLQCEGANSYVAHISDIALGRPGKMYFRPDYFSLPPYMQWFIYAHECAHQLVGSSEAAADCWAMKLGRNQGFFPLQAVQQICSYTFSSPGDWTHFPSPIRCQQMKLCYSSMP
ncbi:hypothetical protein Q8A64_03460 [Oxalobacteraceae bacterium R-40]|uniref:Uncharacterized protein n=1 Tax=Keguizhuia sedimenti TaxID=3064264 RepID=A0ABU1BKD6_9BURK|nr:hypothetical protein [Oxalobacteraceae bacterium R-40]